MSSSTAASEGVAQFKNPTIDMSESSALRSARDAIWTAILLTCGVVLALTSYFDTVYDPWGQNCILSLSYPGPPGVEFEDFEGGIVKLWIESMTLDYSC